MFQLRNLLIALVVLMTLVGCSSRNSGFDVLISITGMTRGTSIFSVMKTLKSVEAFEINEARYKVTGVRFPLTDRDYQIEDGKGTNEPPRTIFIANKIRWRLQPNQPKYLFVVVLAEMKGVDKLTVTEALVARVTNSLLPTVEQLGFEGKVESIKPFDKIF